MVEEMAMAESAPHLLSGAAQAVVPSSALLAGLSELRAQRDGRKPWGSWNAVVKKEAEGWEESDDISEIPFLFLSDN